VLGEKRTYFFWAGDFCGAIECNDRSRASRNSNGQTEELRIVKIPDGFCPTFAVLILTLESCSSLSEDPAGQKEVQVLKIYFQYGFQNELDTFVETYQKDLILDGTVRVPFTLNADEQNEILRKALEITFFSFPDTIRRQPGVQFSPDPSPDILRMQYGDKDRRVVWFYPLDANDPHSKQILELMDVIKAVVEAKPEFKILPPARGEYL
jgi:hypothetical protein